MTRLWEASRTPNPSRQRSVFGSGPYYSSFQSWMRRSLQGVGSCDRHHRSWRIVPEPGRNWPAAIRAPGSEQLQSIAGLKKVASEIMARPPAELAPGDDQHPFDPGLVQSGAIVGAGFGRLGPSELPTAHGKALLFSASRPGGEMLLCKRLVGRLRAADLLCGADRYGDRDRHV